jgi:hypothetical protein
MYRFNAGEVSGGQSKTETTHLQYPCSYPVRVSETERPQKDKSKVNYCHTDPLILTEMKNNYNNRITKYIIISLRVRL